MTGSPIIEVKDLTRRFGALTAVDRLNLEVAPGEIFGLVGPDGAGKTTTLRLLCGLMDPDQGQAWVAGHDVARETDAVKDHIGYMAQRFGLYGDLTVDENMDFYADLFGITGRDRDELLPGLLQMTRMEPFRKRQAGRLSGGMKQKLALMCTLLHKPRVPVSRRAHQRRRPGLAPRLLGHPLSACARRAHRVRHHRVPRRGRALRPRGPDAQRPPDPLRRARQFQERHRGGLLPGRLPRPAGRQDISQTIDGVASAEPFGAHLHLFLSASVTSPEALAAALDAQGLGPATFTPIEPSLEDVFILLIRKESAVAA